MTKGWREIFRRLYSGFNDDELRRQHRRLGMFSSFSAEAREKQEIIREILAERPPERTDTEAEKKLLNREMALRNEKIKLLMRRKPSRPTDDELRETINECRKKNGAVNYSKVGRKYGVTHHTAKSWCRRLT